MWLTVVFFIGVSIGVFVGSWLGYSSGWNARGSANRRHWP